MESFLGLLSQLAAGRQPRPETPSDQNTPDDSEEVQLSPLALLKMLKHANAGIPFEVMGLMLGDCVDEYTVRVVDVFAMPQRASAVDVETLDPVFQTNMMEMLSETGRSEKVVGWYHSHPGCFLSSTDIATQKDFRKLNPRLVALVIDPVQSVRGRVVMDAFRDKDGHVLELLFGRGPSRQTTSNLYSKYKRTRIAIKPGLDKLKRLYYGLPITVHMTELDRLMLAKLRRKGWSEGMHLQNYRAHSAANQKATENMLKLANQYVKAIAEEADHHEKLLATEKKAQSQAKAKFELKYVGAQDPKQHLEMTAKERLRENIGQLLGAISQTVFK